MKKYPKAEPLAKGGMLAIGSMLIAAGLTFFNTNMYKEGAICIVLGGAMIMLREITKSIWYTE